MITSINNNNNNKPAPFQTLIRIHCFSAHTFLKFRFRVLFWRHSQTQLIGSLSDQIRALPKSISSRHNHLRHWSQSDVDAEIGLLLLLLLLGHLTAVTTGAVTRSGLLLKLGKQNIPHTQTNHQVKAVFPLELEGYCCFLEDF